MCAYSAPKLSIATPCNDCTLRVWTQKFLDCAISSDQFLAIPRIQTILGWFLHGENEHVPVPLEGEVAKCRYICHLLELDYFGKERYQSTQRHRTNCLPDVHTYPPAPQIVQTPLSLVAEMPKCRLVEEIEIITLTGTVRMLLIFYLLLYCIHLPPPISKSLLPLRTCSIFSKSEIKRKKKEMSHQVALKRNTGLVDTKKDPVDVT